MTVHPQSALRAARPSPVWARLLAAPAAAAVLLGGLWLFAGFVAPGGYYTSIGFGVGWFLAVYVGLRFLFKSRPGLKLPVRAAFAAVAIAVSFWFFWTTFRDVTVNEQIAVGAPVSESAGAGGARSADESAPPSTGNVQLASGQFVSLVHSSSGTAAIVDLADGGRVLTFENLDTDNGPDLRVYLVEGPVNGNGEGGEFVDLGALKGNQGDQQYEIPDVVDVERLSTVVIWCRAFSVGFARADLESS